ncbi:MAG: HEAT repeat domain-containing protein [Melioribacteraceae bacterium]
MKLSDYFKPKWQRSDLQVRIEAIKKITTEYNLLSVIINDPSLEARLEAVRMLNPDLEKARSNAARMKIINIGDYGDKLFNEIRDRMWNKEKMLVDIVKENYPVELRLEALKFIDKSKDLEELALVVSDLNVFKELHNKIKIKRINTWEILKKLTNQAILHFLALNEDDSNNARCYFGKIHDQDILYEIFKNSNKNSVKSVALSCFKNQQLLYEIALKDMDPEIRRTAVFTLRDEKMLLQLYNNESDSSVREYIADSFSLSQSETAKIAKNDPDHNVRKIAIISLKFSHKKKSQDIFYEIAKNIEEELPLRKIAIENLYAQKFGEYLYLLVRSTESCDLRIAAIENLLENKSKQIYAVIEEIAINDPDIVVKNYATKKLHYEEEFLAKLRSLCIAYTKGDKTEISDLEPEVIAIGEELNFKGGIEEMRRIYHKIGGLPGQRTLEMLWHGIGQWRG